MDLSDRSHSNVHLKVLRSAFTSQSNDIKDKDESTARFNISRLSSGETFSISQSLNFTANSVSHSGWDCSIFMSREEEEGGRLVEALRTAAAGAEILLPAVPIQLQGLSIRQSVTLRGQPGTVLQLYNGAIVVDLRNSPGQVTICELTLEYSAGPTSTDASAAAFYVESHNSSLEVRDCELKSSVTDSKIKVACFWVSSFKAPKFTKTLMKSSSVNAASCTIKNFAIGFRAGALAAVTIERCVILGCRSSSILLCSPAQFKLTQSVIEKCGSSGVEIRLRSDKQVADSIFSSQSTSYSKEELRQTIEISGNDIRQTGSYGVNIWSDQVAAYPLKIKITSNKLSNCRKEAIAVRHIALTVLSIKANDCCSNQGSHLWLQKVYPAGVDAHIKVARNRFCDSIGGYGIYMYDSAGHLDRNEVFHNSLGGLIIVGANHSELEGCSLIVSNSLIHSNGENGVTVMDLCLGTVLFTGTRIYENLHNGLYLIRNRENDTSMLGSSKDRIVPVVPGAVRVENCSITRNRLNGISMSRVLLRLSETVIKENLVNAVDFDIESKALFVIKDSYDRIAELITGKVGGNWGSVQVTKRSLCKGQDCLLL
jgi:hypothetical protein